MLMIVVVIMSMVVIVLRRVMIRAIAAIVRVHECSSQRLIV